jgi:hypothetical protein
MAVKNDPVSAQRQNREVDRVLVHKDDIKMLRAKYINPGGQVDGPKVSKQEMEATEKVAR